MNDTSINYINSAVIQHIDINNNTFYSSENMASNVNVSFNSTLMVKFYVYNRQIKVLNHTLKVIQRH